MKTFISLGLVASLATLTIAERTFHRRIKDLTTKRDYLTCLETYGGGSTTCGDSSSHYCYDPTLGESCCLLDDGYCKTGDFCAAVAGYCCHNGEDPATCAARLSFTLPPSSATATSTNSTDSSLPSDIAVASTTPVASTTTIELLAADSSFVSSTVTATSVPAATLAVSDTQISTTTSAGAMTPDFTALINQTAPSATSSAGLGAGVIQFTGAARRIDLGMGVGVGIGGLLGVAAVARLLL